MSSTPTVERSNNAEEDDLDEEEEEGCDDALGPFPYALR